MAKGTGGGGTVYLLVAIVAIIVAIAMVAVTYWTNGELEKKKREIKTADDKAALAEKATADALSKLAETNKIIFGEAAPTSYAQIAADTLGEFNRKFQEVAGEEWNIDPNWELIKNEEVKSFWKTLKEHKDKPDKYVCLVDCIKDANKLLQAEIHILPRLRLERISADQDVLLKQKQLEDLRNQAKTTEDDLKSKLAQKEDQYNEFARKSDAEKKRLLDEKDKIQKEHAGAIAAVTIDLQRKDLEIRKLGARIDSLTKKAQKSFYETSKPDGEVTYADPKLGYCWIDVGKIHGLRRGTRFEIYTLTKGGRQKQKGYCEVQKVDQDMAQCAVIQESIRDPSDPVVKGDLIRNPIFERNAQPKFWFLGSKLSNRYYNKTEFERKIEEFGGKVLKTLSVDVDFVVILGEGDKSGELEFPDDYKKATELGATFMRETELMDYVGK